MRVVRTPGPLVLHQHPHLIADLVERNVLDDQVGGGGLLGVGGAARHTTATSGANNFVVRDMVETPGCAGLARVSCGWRLTDRRCRWNSNGGVVSARFRSFPTHSCRDGSPPPHATGFAAAVTWRVPRASPAVSPLTAWRSTTRYPRRGSW